MYKEGIVFSNSIEGTIEEMAEVVAQYVTAEGIAVVGIGERAHETCSLRTITLPFLVPAFRSRGWENTLCEDILKDIPRGEWEIIHKELSKHSLREATDVKCDALRDIILNHPKIKILRFNYNKIGVDYDKDSLLILIIKAYDLKINLYGMVSSDELNTRLSEIMSAITNGGRERASDLKKRCKKLLILCGDWHATCLPLQPSELYPDAARFCFGDSLFADKDYPYLNVSVLNGTKEDIIKNKKAFGELGYNFYIAELETLPLGMARILLIKDEKQHRIFLLYHSPVQQLIHRS